jgi:hypothetical protein
MLTLKDPGRRPLLSPQPMVNDLDDDEDDDAYEHELVCLLGRLEQMRDGLATARDEQRPSTSLTLAHDLMEQVIAFADKYCAHGSSSELNDAIMRVSEFYGVLKPLRDQMHGSGVRSLLGMGGRSTVLPEVHKAMTRRCFTSLYEAVFAYFIVFANRFPTSRAVRPWVEVAATFVVEFKRALQDPLPSVQGT